MIIALAPPNPPAPAATSAASAHGRQGRDELSTEMLRRAQMGQPAAQAALVERYQGPVFALLSRTGTDHETADLAQETFLRVFNNLADFAPDGPARLSTWIFTIALRLAKDHREKRARRGRAAIPEWVTRAPHNNDGVQASDAHLDAAKTRRDVYAALLTLPVAQREALVLQYYHHRTLDEIATLTATPNLGTVKSRIARARDALKQALLQGGPLMPGSPS